MTTPASGVIPEVLHFRWDLDKTYLRTEFDSARDLVRTFLQKPHEKRGVPGAAALLRALLAPADDAVERHLMIVSGSPRQMRKVLTERLRLDGIVPGDFILKPNLSNLLLLRLGRIRSQVGYKVGALLSSRLVRNGVAEYLFGDDAEQDALCYSVYADIMAGRMHAPRLEWILRARQTDSKEIRVIMDLYERARKGPRSEVRRIFIRLDRRSPTSRFDAFGSRVVPVFNWFQAALVLHADGMLDDKAVLDVAASLSQEGYTPTRLANSVQDLVRRGYIDAVQARAFGDLLDASAAVIGFGPSAFLEAVGDALGTLEVVDGRKPAAIDYIDYEAVCRDAPKFRRRPFDLRRLRIFE
jgi:hypothetical protein